MDQHDTISSGGETITAAVLVIGDEILSGRTKDRNIGTIAEHLTAIGIALSEVRIVGDVAQDIVAAVNALRGRYTYVFTTGGIGPTHDDITADSIGAAFGVAVDVDPRAVALMAPAYAARGIELNSPMGPYSFRALDQQATLGAYVGLTTVDNGKPTMKDWTYADGAKYQPSDDLVKKLRPAEAMK